MLIVGFVYDEEETITFSANGILNGFPNGIFPSVSIFRQIAIYTQFLSVQEIDFAISKDFFVETIITKRKQRAWCQIVRIEIYLVQ